MNLEETTKPPNGKHYTITISIRPALRKKAWGVDLEVTHFNRFSFFADYLKQEKYFRPFRFFCGLPPLNPSSSPLNIRGE
jgi:hypothetical protein